MPDLGTSQPLPVIGETIERPFGHGFAKVTVEFVSRSEWNTFAGRFEEGHVMCAQADAARTEQAYWLVRAHKEGLPLLPKIEEGK